MITQWILTTYFQKNFTHQYTKYQNKEANRRFYVFAAVLTNVLVFWEVTLCIIYQLTQKTWVSKEKHSLHLPRKGPQNYNFAGTGKNHEKSQMLHRKRRNRCKIFMVSPWNRLGVIYGWKSVSTANPGQDPSGYLQHMKQKWHPVHHTDINCLLCTLSQYFIISSSKPVNK
jgi:hypothetical protein